MNYKLLLAGGLAAGAAASYAGAATLFGKVIPRQDGVKVDMSEMADMQRWEDYKKTIAPRKEWLLSREHETIGITARDGIALSAEYFPCDTPSEKTVIALHGYTSNGMAFCSMAYYFLQKGYNCLMPDLRAHGSSGGDYIGFGILDRYDCLEWIRYVLDRFGEEQEIVLHGTSMGATTALMVTGDHELPEQVKCIIADCAFTSPYDVFAHILRRDYKLPPFPIMNITDAMCRKKAGYGFREYSTLSAMRTNDRPVLFVHGAEDKFVPTEMSRENYEACNAPKELLIVPDAGHGASYYENTELYEEKMTGFLEKWV